MRPPAIFESSWAIRWVRVATAAAIGASLAATGLVAAAATSPATTTCPSAKTVKQALPQLSVGTPVATRAPYSTTCTYPGGGIGSTKITFQVDTAASFAAGEKAAGTYGAKITKVHGLGQAAWTTGLGDIYVFNGKETIKILALSLEAHSPSTATAEVEALARELLGASSGKTAAHG